MQRWSSFPEGRSPSAGSENATNTSQSETLSSPDPPSVRVQEGRGRIAKGFIQHRWCAPASFFGLSSKNAAYWQSLIGVAYRLMHDDVQIGMLVNYITFVVWQYRNK